MTTHIKSLYHWLENHLLRHPRIGHLRHHGHHNGGAPHTTHASHAPRHTTADLLTATDEKIGSSHLRPPKEGDHNQQHG
jgi:hypothetical protein